MQPQFILYILDIMSFIYVPPTIIGPLPRQLVTLGLIKEGELTKFEYDKIKNVFKAKVYFSEQLFLDNLQSVWDAIFDPTSSIGTKLVVKRVTDFEIIDFRDNLEINVNGELRTYDIYLWEGDEKVGFNKAELERAMLDTPIQSQNNNESRCCLSFYKYLGSAGIETKELVYDNEQKQYNVV